MKTIKMKQKRMFFGILALVCFTTLTSCNNDEIQNEETSVISKGLMLICPVYTLGYTEIVNGAGVAHEGKFWFLDVLEFENNNTVYDYSAYRTGTKDGALIHNHEDWVRYPKDSLSICNYVINERDGIQLLSYKTSSGRTFTYTMKCINGKLHSLINERGEEEWIKWEDGETFWSQKYDEEYNYHSNN